MNALGKQKSYFCKLTWHSIRWLWPSGQQSALTRSPLCNPYRSGFESNRMFRLTFYFYIRLLGVDGSRSLCAYWCSVIFWWSVKTNHVVNSDYGKSKYQQGRFKRTRTVKNRKESALNEQFVFFHYSFSIFLRFWLAQIPRLILHDKLSLTKFGRVCDNQENDISSTGYGDEVTFA